MSATFPTPTLCLSLPLSSTLRRELLRGGHGPVKARQGVSASRPCMYVCMYICVCVGACMYSCCYSNHDLISYSVLVTLISSPPVASPSLFFFFFFLVVLLLFPSVEKTGLNSRARPLSVPMLCIVMRPGCVFLVINTACCPTYVLDVVLPHRAENVQGPAAHTH